MVRVIMEVNIVMDTVMEVVTSFTDNEFQVKMVNMIFIFVFRIYLNSDLRIQN